MAKPHSPIACWHHNESGRKTSTFTTNLLSGKRKPHLAVNQNDARQGNVQTSSGPQMMYIPDSVILNDRKNHSVERCAYETECVLTAVLKALKKHHSLLEGC
jgi:hypothetical protein